MGTQMTKQEYDRHILNRLYVYINAAVNAGENLSHQEIADSFDDLSGIEIIEDSYGKTIAFDLAGGELNQALLNIIFAKVWCEPTPVVNLNLKNIAQLTFPRLVADYGNLIYNLIEEINRREKANGDENQKSNEDE